MPKFTAINWAHLPQTHYPVWAEQSSTLLALWPSPIDHDVCFSRAGFKHFEDWDEDWDSDFKKLATYLIEALSNFGIPKIISQADVYPIEKWYHLFCKKKSPTIDLLESILASTHDDQFDPTHAQFGENKSVQIYAGDGHQILWVTLPSKNQTTELISGISLEIPLQETPLKWEFLI